MAAVLYRREQVAAMRPVGEEGGRRLGVPGPYPALGVELFYRPCGCGNRLRCPAFASLGRGRAKHGSVAIAKIDFGGKRPEAWKDGAVQKGGQFHPGFDAALADGKVSQYVENRFGRDGKRLLFWSSHMKNRVLRR